MTCPPVGVYLYPKKFNDIKSFSLSALLSLGASKLMQSLIHLIGLLGPGLLKVSSKK